VSETNPQSSSEARPGGLTPRRLIDPHAEPGQLRDAYRPNRRVRLASDVASACIVVLLIGLLASGFTWDDRAALFDLAASELQVVKLGLGYLAGPILILICLPLIFGRARQVALKRLFRARILLAAALWIAGLLILIAKVSALDGYTLQAGAYVTGGTLIVGLLATLSMWPTGLSVVKIDRAGAVREASGQH
jgi:undecaprenyl pyrophosphate phosphatase UppP